MEQLNANEKVLISPEFKTLVKNRWKVSLALTGVMLFAYFGFLLIVAFYKESFAIYLTSGLTVGLVCGVLIIFLAWILTGVYVNWANNTYDSEIARIKEKLLK